MRGGLCGHHILPPEMVSKKAGKRAPRASQNLILKLLIKLRELGNPDTRCSFIGGLLLRTGHLSIEIPQICGAWRMDATLKRHVSVAVAYL